MEDRHQSPKKTKTTGEKKQRLGFFQRLFGSPEEAAKRRIIKALKKELASAKIDLYKIKKDIISPSIAKILFEIYKLTNPFSKLIQYDEKSRRLSPSFEEHFIMSFHNEKAKDAYSKLNEEYIKKLIREKGPKRAKIELDTLLNDYFDQFDKETINRINYSYSNFLNFVRFTKYDFYPLLREFDPSLEEGNFLKKPSFGYAIGSLLKEDLVKLNNLLYSFKVDDSIDRGVQVFENLHGVRPISNPNLNRLKKILESLRENRYIPLIIQAINKSLNPPSILSPITYDIFTAHSVRIKGEVYKIQKATINSMKEGAVREITSALFNGSIVGRVKNYSELKNEQLSKLGLPTFKYTESFNYLKAFITDKYLPGISKIIHELIVEGIFNDKALLTAISNSYFALNELLKKIDEIDTDLDVEGSRGNTIKRLMFSISKNESARKVLEKTIKDINEDVKLIIDEAILNLKDLALNIKTVIEDYKSQRPKIISNIKKIRSPNNREFIQDLINSYKEIYLFFKLLSIFVPINITKADFEKRKAILEAKK